MDQLLLTKQAGSIHASSLSVQAASDILRLTLIERFGGCWADATALCMQSLDRWLPSVTADFWTYRGSNHLRPGCTWFMCGEPGSEIARAWRRLTEHYFIRGQRSHASSYLWMDQILSDELLRNATLRELWRKTDPAVSCDCCNRTAGPHLIGGPACGARCVDRELNPSVRQMLMQCVPPVMKLSRTRFKWATSKEARKLGNLTNGAFAMNLALESQRLTPCNI